MNKKINTLGTGIKKNVFLNVPIYNTTLIHASLLTHFLFLSFSSSLKHLSWNSAREDIKEKNNPLFCSQLVFHVNEVTLRNPCDVRVADYIFVWCVLSVTKKPYRFAYYRKKLVYGPWNSMNIQSYNNYGCMVK